MSWHIHNVVNTVQISDEIVEQVTADLIATGETYFESGFDEYEPLVADGLLTFSRDAMEHMDYISHESVQKVLRKHKVKGLICFSSVDGDNAGEMWGYRFDGRGGMVELIAEITWVPTSAEQ